MHASKFDVDPGRVCSSPALAVDPKNPLRIVAGYADLRTRRCGLVRSLDGGSTWTRPDAYMAAAQFEAIGGGSSSASKVALAGVVGLLAVGLMLLLGAVLTRRRGGVSPAVQEPPKPTAKAHR